MGTGWEAGEQGTAVFKVLSKEMCGMDDTTQITRYSRFSEVEGVTGLLRRTFLDNGDVIYVCYLIQ